MLGLVHESHSILLVMKKALWFERQHKQKFVNTILIKYEIILTINLYGFFLLFPIMHIHVFLTFFMLSSKKKNVLKACCHFTSSL